MPTTRKSERPIHLGEDLQFQIRMSRMQRIGRWFFGLLLVGALAGVTGRGPVSRATAHDGTGQLSLRFDRFARAVTPQSLELQVLNDESASDFDLWMDADFVRRVQIESILPQPEQQSASKDGIRSSVHVEPAGEFAFIIIRYRPLRAGLLRGRLRVGDATVSFVQLVYP